MGPLTKTCPHCGRELSRAARYCPGCGGAMGKVGPGSPSTPASKVRGEVGPGSPSTPASRVRGEVGPGSPSTPASRVRGATGETGIRSQSSGPEWGNAEEAREAAPAGAPPVAAPPLIPGLVEMRGDARLTQMDRWVSGRLALGALARQLQEPTILSETAQEFYGALLSGEPLSPGQWQTLVEQQLKEAREGAERGGGIWGVFLAGQACLINGWLFKEVFGLAEPRDALADERTRGLVIGAVAHEKWGHGFLSALTALGAESRRLQLDRLRYARLFSGFQVTTPEGVILREKWRAVYNATRFAEEGWATWVETLVKREFAPAAGGPRRALEAWTENFALPELRIGKMVSAQQALQALFDPRVSPEQAKAAMAVVEQAEDELTPLFTAQYGRPPRYVIGYGLCWMIQRRFGDANVPVALMLAGNVVYGLETQGASDVANVIASSPDLNVNHRLAAIAHLPVKDNLALGRREFVTACQDRLGLNIPPALIA